MCVLMIYDPALGKTREQRAFGKDAKGVSTAISRSKESRKSHFGMYDGRRASYGRYQVADTASDAMDKSQTRNNK
jgi:hypothetical protein